MSKPNETSSAGAKVVVACKLPHGLVLETCIETEVLEPVMGGGQKVVKRYRRSGKRVTLNGNAVAIGATASHRIVGGFALTEGVDKDFFEKWLEQNKDLPAVTNGLVFAFERDDMTTGKAKEFTGLRNGMEPMAQKGDPRAPKRIERGLKEAA